MRKSPAVFPPLPLSIFTKLEPPYLRWEDADGVVHAAGHSMKGEQTFCDLDTQRVFLPSSNTVKAVNCMACHAQAEERGILP